MARSHAGGVQLVKALKKEQNPLVDDADLGAAGEEGEDESAPTCMQNPMLALISLLKAYIEHQQDRAKREYLSHDAPERETFAFVDDVFLALVPVSYYLFSWMILKGHWLTNKDYNAEDDTTGMTQPVWYALLAISITLLPVPLLVYLSQHFTCGEPPRPTTRWPPRATPA